MLPEENKKVSEQIDCSSGLIVTMSIYVEESRSSRDKTSRARAKGNFH